VIRVRGAPDEVLRVRETRNGPVISDLDPGRGPCSPVRMSNLEPNDTAAAGFLALNRATAGGARAAAALITSPPPNLVVAARDGGIALYLTGRTPIRAEGEGGAAPHARPILARLLPFDALPHVERPASGQVANANNRVHAGAEPYLGRDWFGDWRFRRIQALLAEAPPSAERFAAMQRDTRLAPGARGAAGAGRAAPRHRHAGRGAGAAGRLGRRRAPGPPAATDLECLPAPPAGPRASSGRLPDGHGGPRIPSLPPPRPPLPPGGAAATAGRWPPPPVRGVSDLAARTDRTRGVALGRRPSRAASSTQCCAWFRACRR
jgi:hypothetical protein